MAETFLFTFAGKVLAILGSYSLNHISSAWGFKDDIEKLKSRLSAIRAVLLDAERQQASNHQLKDWLGKLKDAMYHADDVIDEFQIEAWRRELESIPTKVSKFFSRSNQLAFRFEMAHKIKRVRERFDEIAQESAQFNLTKGVAEGDGFFCRETHSFVDASDVIGRAHDRDSVVKLMHKSDGDKVSVIPIVGLGGLGKTTLAKLVYNDQRIVKQFDLRLWACISEEFELEKVIRKILKSANVGIDCNNLDLEQLQSHLRGELQDRKYFLVLDDVWNDDRSKWIQLESLLKGGATGSKILVTTRSDSVASIVATSSTSRYTLERISNEDSLSLFLKLAFRTRQDAKQHENLVAIAREIVEQCKGVPLAIMTLGNLLYNKLDKCEWINIRDNEIWKLE